MMPGLDGFGVVRRLRQSGRHTPVLFLTARDAPEDKVSGLTLGGDDYVTKPFSLDEVLARIRAVLRRSQGVQRAAEAPRLTFADIELDEESHEVLKAGKLVSLSPTEFKLLRYLMTNAGPIWLTLGGDDYVTKPFSLDEVLARIRAVLRRSQGVQRAAEAPRLTFADIELDEESHEVLKAGKLVSLSPTEFKLLRYLMTNAG